MQQLRPGRERDLCLLCHVRTAAVYSVYTHTHLKRLMNHMLYINSHTHTHLPMSPRIKAELKRQFPLLPDEGTLRRGRRAHPGTRASRPLTKALFIPILCPPGTWRWSQHEKTLQGRERKTFSQIRFYIIGRLLIFF